MIPVFIVFCLLTLSSCSPSNEEALVKYVAGHSFPASGPALSLAVQDAEIVALSEAVHNGKESIETNVKLIEYLIQKDSFSIVALESALPESRFRCSGLTSPDSTRASCSL